jgi:hypothetical protein
LFDPLPCKISQREVLRFQDEKDVKQAGNKETEKSGRILELQLLSVEVKNPHS